MPRHSIVCLVLVAIAVLLPAEVRAECGGNQQCMAVSIVPGVPPSHGTPLVSAPLAFGNQTIATVSAGQPILVAAVLGPPGTLATLNAITLGGVDAADFNIVANTCVVGVPSLLHNGLVTANLADACTITVTFNPAALGAKSAQITVQTAAITRTVPLTGTGTAAAAAASPVTLTAERNRATSIDLEPFTSGAFVTGVEIPPGGAPSNGTASVNGFVLTYTPDRDYLGPDSLTYRTVSSVPEVPATATVTVNVVSRADPANDREVIGLVSAQTQSVRRFSRAQISNFQHRMRSLHRQPDTATASGGTGLAAGDAGPAASGGGAGGDANPLMLAFAGPLSTFFSSGSLDLAAAGGGSLPEIGDGIGLWVGGKARFGTWDQTLNSDRLRFSTDGISAGIDRRFRDDLVLGLGFGYARDDTEVGFNGTNSNSTARSVTGYGSYQPTPDVFVDALVGYGVTNLDTQRFVSSTGAFARADRDGDQIFASLAAGYDFRLERALLSPYARLDYAYDTLDQVTETGAGTDSLTYLEESFSTFQLALGIRGESRHAMRFGWVEPRAFIEYQHNFEGDRPATLVYADQARGPRFSVSPSSIVRDALYVGLGSDLVFRNGTRLGVDYELQLLASDESSQALRFWLSKDFDGKRVSLPASGPASSLFKNPVRVEAGYAFEDNLNRTREADRLSDSVYSLNVSQGMPFALSPNSRFVARWHLDGVKLHTYSGLDHLSGGLNGELQYRSSGSFGTPTFGLFARAALDEYDSGERDGYRYSFGVNVRKSLTDRLHLFAALARNERNADSVVFDGHHYSARLNFDYSIGRAGALYLGGEYREGDSVSSTSAPLTATSTPDDAYDDRALFASRYDARTALLTLGYNWSLGRRDSIDISWTRAHSEPTGGQTFLASGPYGAGGGSRSYTADKYSIFYLMRF